MKKFFKWTSIIILSIILILVSVILGVFISHDRYWFYPTGGKVSELQQKYDALFYDLNLEFNSEEQAISGFVNISLKSLVNDLEIVELELVDNFDISAIEIKGVSTDFEHNNDKILINLQNFLNKDETITLKIYYSGQPIEAIMPPWVGGVNWSKYNETDDWIGVSCQGEGGKIWFPCKSHPSDEPDSVAINITVPDPYVCASNGLLQNVSKPKEGFSTFHWLTKYPINNYNISVNIAKYKSIEKSYTSINGKEIPVIYYHLRDKEKLADSLVSMAIDMLTTFEKYFGEYPFANEKFGLVETSYLGMEHQTINSYGNNYYFKNRNGFKFDKLMLHEMAHEWWGNKVTVSDWADFWIHEGIGTYSEAIYLLEKMGEKSYHRHMAIKKKLVKNDAPILMEKYTSSHSSYSGEIYNKGAYFMHSLRYALGDSIFFSTLYEFITDSIYTYSNSVETNDFLNLVNINSGRDYTPFFNLFLKTTELPNVKIDSLGNNNWGISLTNLEFSLPMDIEADGDIVRLNLSKSPTEVSSKSKIIIDPQNWYLHAKDFVKE
jgi:aminopeptidase N